MTASLFAVIIGALSIGLAYLLKRLVDYVLPPDRHWVWMDKYSKPNHSSSDIEGSQEDDS